MYKFRENIISGIACGFICKALRLSRHKKNPAVSDRIFLVYYVSYYLAMKPTKAAAPSAATLMTG